MAEDNISKQAEEIEVLSSIYIDDWQVVDEAGRVYSVVISVPDKQPITLQVTLPAGYPSTEPPQYMINAPFLDRHKKVELENALNEVYMSQIGEPVIYNWIEKIKEVVENESSQQEDACTNAQSSDQPTSSAHTGEEEKDDEGEEVYDEDYDFTKYTKPHNNPPPPEPTQDHCECPAIYHTEPLLDRKSKFIGHLAPVTHPSQVQLVLDRLKEDKKIAIATHNIVAYRIKMKDLVYQDCEDDGETHASNRMLHLMQIVDAMNVLVVITRWYGGIHLGPDRFKHINNLTRQLLEEHGYINDKAEKRRGKKKR